MCCDKGAKERLRIEASEWAAEEKELCAETRETLLSAEILAARRVALQEKL